jgi:hypothetical protein
MKKTSIATVILMGTFGTLAQANLLTNGSFEAGTDGWTCVGVGINPDANGGIGTLYPLEGSIPDGSKVAYLEAYGSNAVATLSQSVALSAGLYKLSWSKAMRPNPWTFDYSDVPYLTVTVTDSSNHVIASKAYSVNNTNAFASIRIGFSIPEDGTYTVTFSNDNSHAGIFTSAGHTYLMGDSAFLLDNVVLKEASDNGGMLVNGSFEADTYGWTCVGVGINPNANGGIDTLYPLQDSIPDGSQVAYLEAYGSNAVATLSQSVTLSAGLYKLSWSAAMRPNPGTFDWSDIPYLTVTVTDSSNHVIASKSYSVNNTSAFASIRISFSVPEDGTYTVTFSNDNSHAEIFTSAGHTSLMGDSAFLLDNVVLMEASSNNGIVVNGSFEADTYGWTCVGGVGINPDAGGRIDTLYPLAVPNGDSIAYLTAVGSETVTLSQSVTLSAGVTYTLSWYEATRQNPSALSDIPRLTVTLGDQTLSSHYDPVYDLNDIGQFAKISVDFTVPSDGSYTLTFTNPGSEAKELPDYCLLGIASLMLDDIEINVATPKIPVVAAYGLQPGSDYLDQFLELAECGFTVNVFGDPYSDFTSLENAMNRACAAGVKMFITPFGNISEFVNYFKNHPALEGYYLKDEPAKDEFSALAVTAQTIQSLDPDHWCYINLLPSTDASYYQTFLNTVPVKVLSFDRYPITTIGGVTKIDSYYYKNLEIVSSAARAKGVPFWVHVLSSAHSVYPVPTRAHLRFQIYSSLAYGAQGIQYFSYRYPGSPFTDSPIDGNLKKTSTWYLVQSMTQEFQGLASVFMGSTVKSVGHTVNSDDLNSTIPDGTADYENKAPITSLTTSGSDGAVVSRMLNGHTWYLAVVNRDIDSTMTLHMTVDASRGISTVSKTGIVTPLSGSSFTTTVDKADIVVFKWAAIPGDANLDGEVSVSDLSVLAAYYNTVSGATWAMGDFDGDKDVDVADLSLLAANYNYGSASTVSWAEAYAQAFGTTNDADETTDASADDSEDTTSSVCSSLGLSLIAGLALMGLMIVKLEE